MMDTSLLCSEKQIEKFAREYNKWLKKAFSGRITGNFLLEITKEVVTRLAMRGDLPKYFNMSFDSQTLIRGEHDSINYEICRYIVGAHRSNTIFLEDKCRAGLEKDEKYRKQLIDEVDTNICLRNYAGVFFRKRQMVLGDEFIFFNLPHDLFALSIRSLGFLQDEFTYQQFYVGIFNKALVTLSLVEDNFLDSAYPHCRSLIELYLKLIILKYNPQSIAEFDLFEKCDVDRNVVSKNLPEEIGAKYDQRKWKRSKTKMDFLHFGWVDTIDDYFKLANGAYPYSISGLSAYLQKKDPSSANVFKSLANYYQLCSVYAHGNRLRCPYPLADYLEVCTILGIILPHAYSMLCDDVKQDMRVNGIDLVVKTSHDFETTIKQRNMMSLDNLKRYYGEK